MARTIQLLNQLRRKRSVKKADEYRRILMNAVSNSTSHVKENDMQLLSAGGKRSKTPQKASKKKKKSGGKKKKASGATPKRIRVKKE